MMRDVWRRRWRFLMLAVTASTRLSAQAQESILSNVAPTSGLILIKPGAHAEKRQRNTESGRHNFLNPPVGQQFKGAAATGQHHDQNKAC